MSEILGTKLIKLKMLIDNIIGSFSNAYKTLFCIDVLGINTPKLICDMLNMAKSNLALLASKLKLQKFIQQDNSGFSSKNIAYSVTPLGHKKLAGKLKKVGASNPDEVIGQINNIIGD